MKSKELKELRKIAENLNWFAPPNEVMRTNVLLNLVMARGTIEDTVAILSHYSESEFREAYANAPAGLYCKKSWAYWGLKLLGNPDALPHPGVALSVKRDFNWRIKT